MGKVNDLAQVSDRINELLDRAESGLREQKHFSEHSSRELKTILAATRGILEVLVRRQREAAIYEPKIKEAILHIDRITTGLDQAFLLCWLNSGKVHVSNDRIHLFSFLSILEDKWLFRLYDNKISLHINIPDDLEIVADCYLLEVLLDNIISDAVKFGRKWGNIYIVWNDTAHTVSISNDGYGISSGHQSMLLEQHKHGDQDGVVNFPGSGLRMAVAMKAAALMYTHLEFSSGTGSGSSFTMQFSSPTNLSIS